jgi:hypothetical protein
MEIIENEELYFSPIDYPYEEFKDGIYNIYFAYNITETVTGVSNLQITVTTGAQPISVTAEHCANSGMVAQGNIYVIHVALAKYDYLPSENCNRIVKVSGGWKTEELPIDIPISVQVLQVGCKTNKATATFIDGDGNVLLTQQYTLGDTPSYSGPTPTKTETSEYTYVFNGQWLPELEPIYLGTNYVAQFDEIPTANPLFYVHENEPVIDNKVPYELSGGASLVVRNGKYYVQLTSASMFIKLELNSPMRVGQVIEIHTQKKYKPAITGTEIRNTHNSMVLVGGEDSDYIYQYTIVGNEQDSRENLEGESTLYVWRSGSSTHVRFINIE